MSAPINAVHIVMAKESPYIRILKETEYLKNINKYQGILQTIVGNKYDYNHILEISVGMTLSNLYQRLSKNPQAKGWNRHKKVNDNKYYYATEDARKSSTSNEDSFYQDVGLEGYNITYFSPEGKPFRARGSKNRILSITNLPEPISDYIMSHEETKSIGEYFG